MSRIRNVIARFVYEAALRVAGAGKSRARAMRFSHASREAAEQGRWQDAIFSARAAISADPSWTDGYRMLGLAMTHAGNMEGARKAYQRGLEANPRIHAYCER